MSKQAKINILLVDDQPSKLLAYEVMLLDLGENLIRAHSARDALETLLKTEVAIVLMDVSMPELDGFELAAIVREHPRFQHTAIIFVSAVHLSELDFLRGYQMGAVDYVSVPVVPEVLRAKVKVFADLYRKTQELEQLNASLEARVADRAAALEKAAARLLESERRRTLALVAGQMGSWDWDLATGDVQWDEGQYRILGVEAGDFAITLDNLRSVIHAADWERLETMLRGLSAANPSCQAEFRIHRPDGELRWCLGTAAATNTDDGRLVRLSGVTIDITDRKRTEEQQVLLMREVDHRAKNVLAVAQSLVRLSRADTIEEYRAIVEGRIQALSRIHTLIANSRWQGADLRRLIQGELAPYDMSGSKALRMEGTTLSLEPSAAQTLALALHELGTNAAKYGAFSEAGGQVLVKWEERGGTLYLSWIECGGPSVERPQATGFGIRLIQRAVEAQLDGKVEFEWSPQGLHCMITVPLRLKPPAVPALKPPRAANGHSNSRAKQILIVEDEIIIGIMLADLVTVMDFVVVGPLTSVAEASEPATRAPLDAALLDVTLRDEWVYPIADILAARGVPFAFLTGHGTDSLDPRFKGVPILEKPVDREALVTFLSSLNGTDEVRPLVELEARA